MKASHRFTSIVAIATVLLFFSCEKEIVKPIEQAPQDIRKWERFVGQYNVYSTQSHLFLYSMEIKGMKNADSMFDTLCFYNYADRFNFLKKWSYTHMGDSIPLLLIGVHHPITDYNGQSWHLSSLISNAETEIKENTMVNDTLYLYHKLSNAAFYLQDGVPYFHEEVLEMAVKQK